MFFTNLKQRIRSLLLRNPSHAHYKFILRDWIPLLDLPHGAQVLETQRFSRNLRPVEMTHCPARRILVFAPHPDDDTFGAGGTLLRSISEGASVQIIYLTDGSNQPEQRARIREEATAVCRFMKANPVFTCFDINHIPIEEDPRLESLRAQIHKFQPDVLFLPFLLDDHDDHRRVSHLLLHLAAHHPTPPREIWAYQIYSTLIPNVIVKITEVMERKRELIRLWKSVSGERNWEHWVSGQNAFNSRFLSSREAHYVETFFVTPWEEYLQLCRIYFSAPNRSIYYAEDYRDL